ncbi:hypothetical protein [Inquilinus limosus]|uniref:hypothetical protein n=1 Tax=Inquilinus limosus TaxID=171674 RepID=UPI00138AB0C3|nr:hypothetical protein [Inquilinus limosus]
MNSDAMSAETQSVIAKTAPQAGRREDVTPPSAAIGTLIDVLETAELLDGRGMGGPPEPVGQPLTAGAVGSKARRISSRI